MADPAARIALRKVALDFRGALLVAFTALLGGCLATLNGAFKVHGFAPSRGCVLQAENLGTHRKEHWDVAGEFTETVIAAEPNPGSYDVSLVCDGQVRQSLHGVQPSYEHWRHPVELGDTEKKDSP